jgi:phospholipid-binding lipoprotein MlaA
MKNLLTTLLTLCLVWGCAGRGQRGTPLDSGEDFSSIATQRTADPLYNGARMVLDDVEKPLQVRDPFEGFNRTIYRLNANLDRVLLPAVSLYERFIPNFARQGVTNFFDNLDDIRTGFNQVLQLRPRRALETTGRFITNSTLGLAGLFDVASRTGQRKYDEDFGQTLGRYGVAPGPYLVLPLFGPSGLRDGFGRVFDASVLSLLDPLALDGDSGRQAAYYPLLIIDTRATTAFEYFSTGSPFEYELVRLLYSKKRELDIVK